MALRLPVLLGCPRFAAARVGGSAAAAAESAALVHGSAAGVEPPEPDVADSAAGSAPVAAVAAAGDAVSVEVDPLKVDREELISFACRRVTLVRRVGLWIDE